MKVFHRRWLGPLGFCLLVAVVMFAARRAWLPVIGTTLESSGPARKADIAVVLGGDYFGDRILTAARLARDGYVTKVLVSGPGGQYGYFECDLAIAFAVSRGYPASSFLRAPHQARSTREEAAALVPELRRLGVKSLLLVTSDFHTRRAGRIFRAALPDVAIYPVAAPDTGFRLNRWWEQREGRKMVTLEWAKTVADRLGL